MKNSNHLKYWCEGFLNHESIKCEYLKSQNKRKQTIKDKQEKQHHFCKRIGRANILKKIYKDIHTGFARSPIISATFAGRGTLSNSIFAVAPAV